MPDKRIHIFANSVKFRGFCIAGRELSKTSQGWEYGDWIRPVSDESEGQLTRSHCEFEDEELPELFDVVSVRLKKHAPSKHQPENWLIDTEYYWKKVQMRSPLPDLPIDNPKTLWCPNNGQNDRITPTALSRLSDKRSLSLVEVTKFRMQFGWQTYDGRTRKRRRGLFKYKSRDYDLALTDPGMEKYCSPYPREGTGTKTVRLDCGRECLVCVSLTGELNGYHYKVVATVIET